MVSELYLLEYEADGKTPKRITPNAPLGLIGAYLSELPVSIAEMLELGTIEEVIENGKIYYKIIGGNE